MKIEIEEKKGNFREARGLSSKMYAGFWVALVFLAASFSQTSLAASGSPWGLGGADSAKKKDTPKAPASKPTWKPIPTSDGGSSGCNFGAPKGTSGVLISSAGCPLMSNHFGLLSGPSILFNNDPHENFLFGYHDEGEKQIIANLICQQVYPGSQPKYVGGSAVLNPNIIPANFRYVDIALTPQTYTRGRDDHLKYMVGLSCYF